MRIRLDYLILIFHNRNGHSEQQQHKIFELHVEAKIIIIVQFCVFLLSSHLQTQTQSKLKATHLIRILNFIVSSSSIARCNFEQKKNHSIALGIRREMVGSSISIRWLFFLSFRSCANMIIVSSISILRHCVSCT